MTNRRSNGSSGGRWAGIERPYTKDDVAHVIAGGMASTTALAGSTEEEQFS
jgi:isocitrate lyase